jgi:GT2 family glycosyltransferase
MAEPDVTVVVVPRERFSVARRALECLLSETTYPFRLVYIDGASPRSVKRYLDAEARRSGFRLLRSEHHLSPTEARNLGLREAAGTRYVVFIDNDVLVRAGWLEALVGCADETDAWLVGPLYCFGDPPFSTIHMAGGAAHIEVRDGGRYMSERHHWPGSIWARCGQGSCGRGPSSSSSIACWSGLRCSVGSGLSTKGSSATSSTSTSV